jgi:polysaccharide biosynthesis transport protein
MSNSVDQPQVINMSDALRGIWRRKILVLSTLILGALAGAALLTVSKPAYQSEAQVIIENLSTPYEKTNTAQDQRSETVDDRVVLSQVAVLKSQDLAARVSDALKLTEKKEFNPLLSETGTLKKIMIATGFADDPKLMTAEQLAVNHVMSQLNVYPVPESNVIGIKYKSGDGQTAADVANAIAESYVLSTRETEAGSTNRAREWLSQQIADLQAKVSQSEAEVEKYRSEAGLLKGSATSTLGEQQIAELNTQITLAEAASSEASARASEIKSLLSSKGSVDASSDVLSSSVIQNLREQQATTSRKMSELSATYLPNHPKMIAVKQELQSINGQIRREALKVVESLAGQSKVAAARAESLRASLEKMKGRQAGANLSDVKLKELERNALANRTLLETMLARFADASARQDLSLQPGFARIIQKAYVQSVPYFPKPGPIMFLTSMAGLGLGLGLAFLLEVMSAAARMNPTAPEPARRHAAQAALESAMSIAQLRIDLTKPGTPAAPIVEPVQTTAKTYSASTSMPSATSLVTALSMIESTIGDQQSGLTQAARQIASDCIIMREQQGIKSILFTSIGSKSPDAALAIVATARSIAAAKLKVIVVDVSADSSLEALFGLPLGPGLSDLVLGEADFTKIICRDPHSATHAIRYGLKSGAQSKTALAEKLASILTALAEIYDLVLVHAGEASPSTPALAKDCKGAVLLAPQARKRDAAAAAKTLASKGVLASAVVNLDVA